MAELQAPAALVPGRIRRASGGRKKAVDRDPSVKTDLEQLLESTTRGDPEAPLRWTCESLRKLTAELQRLHHRVSHQVVADLLHELGYRLQANRKTKEGTSHPGRKAQFEHRLFSFITQNWRGKPLISLQAIVSLIAATTTTTGLRVHSELDTASYESGIKVSDQDIAQVKLRRDKFHGDWNYEIHPRKPNH
jgi:transposase